MTLQEAIDNAPSWARWIGVDAGGESQYYMLKPKRIFGGIYVHADIKDCEFDLVSAFTITDATGPQLIEVNKMKNWYCKPASEAEAIEIVKRAIANGAVAKEVPRGFDFSCVEFSWDYCAFWGVHDGNTFTHDVMGDDFKRLTIQQVREQFPLPNEIKVMSKKEWQGMQDGLPPVGDWVMSPGGAQVFYVGTSSIGGYVFELEGGGLTVFDSVDGFSKIPNERERWVEHALNVLQKDPCAMPSQLMGMVYDALKSGALKAPEAE